MPWCLFVICFSGGKAVGKDIVILFILQAEFVAPPFGVIFTVSVAKPEK